MNEKQLPKRKSTRLSNFDYTTPGAYFVTICTENRKRVLSDIVKPQIFAVGEGLAPPVSQNRQLAGHNYNYQYDLEAPIIILKPCGRIAEEQLLLLEKRYPNLTVEDYVIMPDHIHARRA